jgi:anti-sigma factor RsiW
MNHPAEQELFDYADGLLGPSRSALIRSHLEECSRCRAAVGAAVAVSGALRRIGPERPSPQFTGRLLNRLGLQEATPLWWLFLRNLAPLLVAAGVAGTLLVLGGGGEGTQGGSAQKSLIDVPRIAAAVREAVGTVSAWTTGLFTSHVSFSLGRDALSQTVYLALLFAAIALLDRYVLGPMLRRRHQG